MSHRLRFGRVEIDPIERQLWVDAEAAVLGARAFDLLLALLERRERTVPKAELLDLVWPGLVVEENNLQVQVGNLRKLLGPQSIATIPGRGYRFALTADDGNASPDDGTGQGSASAATSGTAARQTLPPMPESFFGREDDLAALQALLAQHRLVTVLGAGGIGKTSLALAATHRQAASATAVAWVELAPLADAGLVPSAIAQALQLPMGVGDPVAALVTSIQPVHALLVLDNAEHLIDGVARLAQALLAGAPGVRLLVTSQAPLKIDGEWLFQVGSLAVPALGTPLDEALRYGAVALFDARARAADRHFVLDDGNVDLVIDLCGRLDGLALAIRLAAARVPLFGLQGLHTRLAQPLSLLRGTERSVPTRQQTLRATHDWSHALLTVQEQVVFRRLGVFVGGFSLASAVAVAQDATDGAPDPTPHDSADHDWAVIDALAVLVERCLVVADDRPEPRYRLLDSAREYALERQGEAGERQALQQRHAQRMLALLEQSIADDRSGLPDRAWVARYACELDDVRAAIDWAEQHEPAMAVALTGAAESLFMMLGLLHEAWHRVERIRPQVDGAIPALVRARFLDLHSRALDGAMQFPRDDPWPDALEAFRSAGDVAGVYIALGPGVFGGPSRAREVLDEMARIEQPHWSLRLRLLRPAHVAIVDTLEGRLEAARAGFERVVGQTRAVGRERLCANLLLWLAGVEGQLGMHAEAVAHCREAVALCRERGASNLQVALRNLLSALLVAGHLDDARRVADEAIALTRRMGWLGFSGLPLRLALLAARCGHIRAAAQLIGLSDKSSAQAQDSWTDDCRRRVMDLAGAALAPDELQRLLVEGAALDPPSACALALADPR